MAEVERKWFRQRFAGQDVPNRYQSVAEPDGDFDGAVPDQAVVDEAWAAWHSEVAFAEQFARDTDFSFVGPDGAGEPISLRELLVHMSVIPSAATQSPQPLLPMSPARSKTGKPGSAVAKISPWLNR